MKGDFSRFIFDSKKHYTSVLFEQGRVLSDAALNHQQSINQYRFETEAQDVIGLCGVPEDVGGFELSLLVDMDGGNWDIAISPGRLYIDGLLCELEASTSTLATEYVVNDKGEGIGIQVASLMPDGQPFQKYEWIEIFGTDLPATQVPILEIDSTAGILKFDAPEFIRKNKDVTNFNAAKDRRVRRIITYITQHDYPNPDFTAPSANGKPPTLKLEPNKTYLAYFHAFQRDRTHIDHPRLQDLALGGSDGNVCQQTVWQVKLLPVDVKTAAFDPKPTLDFLQSLKDKLQKLAQERIQARDRQTASFINGIQQPITPFLDEFPTIPIESRPDRLRNLLETLEVGLESFIQLADRLGLPGLGELPIDRDAIRAELARLKVPPNKSLCNLTYPEWEKLTAASTGTLNVRTQTPQSDDNPCLLPPTAGYQRLENQNYRFEMHGKGLIKWSRDNGSVVTAIEKMSGQEITVQTVGPDEVLGFANGQWVEIIDDRLELNGQPGELIQIANVNPATRVITLQTAPTPLSTNSEGVDKTRYPKLRRWDSEGAIPISSSWFPVEVGIQARVEGDPPLNAYWMVRANVASGEVEFPPYEVPNNNPIPQLPLGIKHHYCRLAILTFVDQKLKILEDCRQLFPPLTKVKVDSGIHIIEVSVLDADNQPVPLKNDTEIPFEMLTKELRIVCDHPIDLQVFKSNKLHQPHPACFLTISLPFPLYNDDREFWESGNKEIFGYQPVTLSAKVDIVGNTISWRPAPTVENWLPKLRDKLQDLDLPDFSEGVRVLINLTLKGNFIWAANNPKKYLDGEAFGTRDDETASNLRLPSGDGRRGGDFEMWFWLVPPPRLIALRINPPTVKDGLASTGVVELDKTAPDPGVVISLTSSDNTVATVPVNVKVAARKTSAEFQIITTGTLARGSRPTVTITASLAGEQQQAPLEVIGAPIA